MDGKLTVEMDFDTNELFLQINSGKTSDMRDKAINHFLELAGMDGAILQLVYNKDNVAEIRIVTHTSPVN